MARFVHCRPPGPRGLCVFELSGNAPAPPLRRDLYAAAIAWRMRADESRQSAARSSVPRNVATLLRLAARYQARSITLDRLADVDNGLAP